MSGRSDSPSVLGKRSKTLVGPGNSTPTIAPSGRWSMSFSNRISVNAACAIHRAAYDAGAGLRNQASCFSIPSREATCRMSLGIRGMRSTIFL